MLVYEVCILHFAERNPCFHIRVELGRRQGIESTGSGSLPRLANLQSKAMDYARAIAK